MILLSHDARVLKPWSLRGWAPFASHSVHREALMWLQYCLIVAGIWLVFVGDCWFLMQLIDFYIDGGEWLIVGKFVCCWRLIKTLGRGSCWRSIHWDISLWLKQNWQKRIRWSFRATRGVWKSIYIHPSLGASCAFYKLEIGGLTCPSRVWAQCREDHTQDTLGRETLF